MSKTKVFKCVRMITSFIEIDTSDPDDLEAWEDAITEDGTYDTDAMIELLQEGDDYGTADSEDIVLTELSDKEAEAYLADLPINSVD